MPGQHITGQGVTEHCRDRVGQGQGRARAQQGQGRAGQRRAGHISCYVLLPIHSSAATVFKCPYLSSDSVP